MECSISVPPVRHNGMSAARPLPPVAQRANGACGRRATRGLPICACGSDAPITDAARGGHRWLRRIGARLRSERAARFIALLPVCALVHGIDLDGCGLGGVDT